MAEPRIIGIPFQPWKALAIHNGATVTRRLMNPQPDLSWRGTDLSYFPRPWDEDGPIAIVCGPEYPDDKRDQHKPRYRPGDLCYCKEAWLTTENWNDNPPRDLPDNVGVELWADPNNHWPYASGPGRYRHARFMPRRFARTWIEMVDVRPERLCSDVMTPEEVEAEGITVRSGQAPWEAFEDVWDRLHPDHKMIHQPWEWRYQFKLTEAPDDTD